jgi:hypothetical protein
MRMNEISLRDRSSAARAATSPADERRTDLASSQTRTCVRCGRYTTFVLDDPAGGWYACRECGHYA